MKLLGYTLSEQVCLQSLIVAIRLGGWTEWFSNPTAGPWKKLRIEGVGDKDEIRYLKEQDRPDLIAARIQEQVIIVIEAKDNLAKLLDGSQIKKSVEVFEDNFKRIDGIVAEHGERLFGENKVLMISGYLFPITKGSFVKTSALSQLHMKFVSQREDKRLLPQIFFMVQQDDSQNLHLRYEIINATSTQKSRLGDALPRSISLIGD